MDLKGPIERDWFVRSMEVYEALKVKKKNNLDNAIETETE